MNKAQSSETVSVTWLFAAAFSVFTAFGASAAMTPREVMVKNEEARKIADSVAKASLSSKLGDKERVKEFTWWRKLLEDGTRFNTLTRFHSPAEVRGEGILFLEHASDQNEVLMYLPAFKKIRRVESQQQSSSFM